MPGRVGLTIVLALVAAFLDALSNVLEIAEAEQIAEAHSLRPSLITNLARRPRWLVGLVVRLVVGGAVRHPISLGTG